MIFFLRNITRIFMLTFLFSAGPAFASTWPSQPVKLVVPFTAGGSTDAMARLIANRLSPALGQPVIIENRPGAGGVIGANTVIRSEPDGHTLLVAISSMMALLPTYMKEPPYDPLTAFTPITQITTMPMVLLVNADSPIDSVSDLIAQSKKETLNYASVGPGSMHHLTSELLVLATGAQLNHIPYKGAAPAITDLIGGHVDVFPLDYTSAAGHVSANKIKALAVTGKERHPMLPDVPTMLELDIPVEAEAWTAVFAPAGTPKHVVERLNLEIDKIVTSPDFTAELLKMGGTTVGGSSENLAHVVQSDLQKWAEIIDNANIERQ